MSLKISLKPRERMILGGAVVENGGARCDLIVENNVPILREKDILRERDADTPCKRIYFAIQLMYVDEKNICDHHERYWAVVREVLRAAPSTVGMIDEISEHILAGRYYQALKLTRNLIAFEHDAIDEAHGPAGDAADPERTSSGDPSGSEVRS